MRKLLALVLSVTMIFCAIPVFAQEGSQVTEPEKTDISKAVVVLSDNAESQVYTGEAIVLADDQITVTLGGGTDAVTLKNGTDYEVKYSNNVNAGTAEISIIGKGIYGGEVKAELHHERDHVPELPEFDVQRGENISAAEGKQRRKQDEKGYENNLP